MEQPKDEKKVDNKDSDATTLNAESSETNESNEVDEVVPNQQEEDKGKKSGYLGSFFSSGWTKSLAKTANEAASTAASASQYFSFATKPDEEDPAEEVVVGDEINDDEAKEAAKNPDPNAAGEVAVSALTASASMFFSDAMNKMKMMTMTGSEEQDDAAQEEVKSPEKESSYFPSVVGWDDMMGKATSLVDNLKDKVSNANMLSEFNKEQENFIKSKSMTNIENGLSPWIGYQREDELKAKILGLSEDKRNFVRAPPAGVTFEFDYSPQVFSVATALLKEDPRLEAMRYELVPKKVKEDDFWRNYFYRVNLIQQSFEINNIDPSEITGKPTVNTTTSKNNNLNDDLGGGDDDEFVSDSYVASSKDMAEADASIKRLNNEITEADLEAELESELQEYEVVKDESNPEWESQIQELLEAEDKKLSKK